MESSEKRVVLFKSTAVSGAATTSDAGRLCVAGYSAAIVVLSVTAHGGTTPTLDVYVQQELPIVASTDLSGGQPNGTSVWSDLVHFTQVTTTDGTWEACVGFGTTNVVQAIKDGTLSAGTVRNGPIGTNWRVKYTVGGTNPTYTFAVTAILIP